MNNLTNNNFNNYPLQAQQNTIFFPQPQGMVYSINNSMELSSIPVNGGVSVAICLPEEMCYIKTIQNGMPIVTTYKLLPQNGTQKSDRDIKDILSELDQRLRAIEAKTNKGGRLDELI